MKHHYLITTHNNANHIEAAVESIRHQYTTLADCYEAARILIVDDASTDGTSDKVEQIARRYRNAQSHRNPTNRGVGHNRNLLLNWLMSGNVADDDLVMFVNGDSLLPEKSLQIRLDEFDADPDLDCVGGQIEVMDAEGRTISNLDTFCVDPQIEAIAELFECHFYVSNAAFRARVFRAPATRFPSTRVFGDWLFFASNHHIKRRHARDVTVRHRRDDPGSSNATRALRSDDGDASRARHAVRTIELLSLGMLHNNRDHQLMDMIGSLSFQLRWRGLEAVFDPGIKMPWFADLRAVHEVEKSWPGVRQEISGLFDRISNANRVIARFDQTKLDAYLAAMLDAADQTVRGGRVYLSMVPSNNPTPLHAV